jgi:hypothetical protein
LFGFDGGGSSSIEFRFFVRFGFDGGGSSSIESGFFFGFGFGGGGSSSISAFFVLSLSSIFEATFFSCVILALRPFLPESWSFLTLVSSFSRSTFVPPLGDLHSVVRDLDFDLLVAVLLDDRELLALDINLGYRAEQLIRQNRDDDRAQGDTSTGEGRHELASD